MLKKLLGNILEVMDETTEGAVEELKEGDNLKISFNGFCVEAKKGCTTVNLDVQSITIKVSK